MSSRGWVCVTLMTSPRVCVCDTDDVIAPPGDGVRDAPAPLGRLDRGAAAAAMMGGGVSSVCVCPPPQIGGHPSPTLLPKLGGGE